MWGLYYAYVYDTMQQLTLKLEEHVRRHPGEWFWLQDRWRTKKEDTPEVEVL